MTPVEQAAAVYQREACARSFDDDLAAHLKGGYVFSTPDAFVMIRPVRSFADERLIVDPWVKFEREDCNAWLVYLAAGDLASLLPLLPYPLPLIGWERKNRLRWRSLEKTFAKIGKV